MGPSLPGLEVCLTWPQAKVVVRFRAQPQPQRGPVEATRVWRQLSPRHSPKAWQEPPGMHLSPHKRERRQCQKRGPGQGFLKLALKRVRRRVTAERFRLALKLVSRLTGRPGQLRAQRAPNAKEASEPEKTSLPENPRPRGLVPGTGRERGVPRARLCRCLRGTWKTRLCWTRRETSRRRKPRARSTFPGALRVGSGQHAEGGAAGRLHPGPGVTLPASRTPSGPCPFNSAGQGAPSGAGDPLAL